MEKYEEIENDAHNIRNTTRIIITPLGQELKLQSLAKEITYEIELELEENQLNNMWVLKVSNCNTTKQLKLLIFTRVGKSAETAMTQFAT